jgi:multicomponent Na+:H+ antiporter subunit B
MSSVILQTATRSLISLLLVVALFALVRGHNEPGGGFIAGLGVTAAVVLYGLAFGAEPARSLLRVQPRVLVGAGLLVALASATAGLLIGDSFFDGLWTELDIPGMDPLKLGTPLLFDVGVAMVVVGTGVGILVALLEDE